ncbi:hypothetical protein ACE38V_01265 [Cytobacillus sp. Hz8]|uniref:hypothetical protein n=1 Tax=Cytobacillus sp. Hz8 TaxID=3347168 RepID=UPI0035DF7552
MPFHQYGRKKYENLGKEYQLQNAQTLPQAEIDLFKSQFFIRGIQVVISRLE